ncbi:fatty acid synthesis protein [Marinomonas balearica]|uniref:Phosphate acyltransferase n=1 Tax=Marinomonas balearica TaxID=491947 RepID=A0A4R6M9L6_9GAMM|nr:fatty acid synthesis protein [Marinomonas balearica]TDO96879.1 phosphate:acyl-[acyl carrier protein] acyltransferase [Marinomonas balearica]
MIRVAIDAMGGDLGPRVAFQAAKQVLETYPSVQITLYLSADDTLSSQDLSQIDSALSGRFSTVVCSDFISGDEQVNRTLYRRSESTLYRSLYDMSEGAHDVVVTLGNTAAMVALARRLLGLIRPRLHPALVRELRLNPLCCLLDLGANVHCPAQMLEGFSILGAAYTEVLRSEPAKVALLNVGVESTKGNSVIRQADSALSSRMWPEYNGYAEGFDLFGGESNVLVCDGMVGNTVLKASEGLLTYFQKKLVKTSINKKELESFYESERHHGASFIGVRGNLVKGHGRSDFRAAMGAIEYGIEMARADLWCAIDKKLEKEGFI